MTVTTNDSARKLIAEDRYPGLSVLNFRFLFTKIKEVLYTLNDPYFPSPYSIIPFISQSIGLDIPIMGSGKSPYSIVSYFTKLRQNIFLEKGKGLTFQERRELIDELYNMIAPYMLDEQSEYIELLIDTKYKKLFHDCKDLNVDHFRSIMRKKFNILHRFLSKIKFSGGNYSHLAHYGYIDDLYREQDFIKDFDSNALQAWSQGSYPIVLEMQIDNFEAKNKWICGWYILVPNYTEELLRDKSLRQKKILQAATLAKKLGAKFSGMAGLMASFTKGGKFLAEHMPDFGFTTGHSFTIANIYEIFSNVTKEVSLDLSKSCIAIVGAAGSIGSGVAKLISENNIKDLYLIDRSNMVSTAKLKKLKIELDLLNSNNSTHISKCIEDASKCDLLIVATNSSTSFIKSEHLKKGAIIIDDSFPKNVSRSLLKEREDIILLEGGVSQMPKKQNGYVARNIPDLLDLSVSKLISCKQSYGCLCETFILAAFDHKGNYGLGDADPELAKEIMKKGKQLGFASAVFQNYGFAVEESRLVQVKNIIKDRFNG